MSDRDADRQPPEIGEEPGYRERLGAVFAAAGDLLSTRAEIFGEEAGQKAAHLARGLAALAAALVAGGLAMLLLVALCVALFTLLFGQLWAGILATVILDAAAAAAAVFWGWKALSKVRPFDFPVRREELARDWEAVTGDALRDSDEGAPADGDEIRPSAATADSESSWSDIEARFRAGSE
jgi:uncharacterized membrane protein YqjE